MTALLLHGVIAPDAPEPSSAVPHRRIAAHGVTGIATQVSQCTFAEREEPPLSEARMHHELLVAYAARSAVRPVRFGSVFSGEAALSEALKGKEAEHLAWLQSMADHIEYVLKVLAESDLSGDDTPAPVSSDTGRSFLERKRAARDDRRTLSSRRSAFAASIPGVADAVVADIVPLRTAAPETFASYAFLTDRKMTQDLLDLAQALGRDASRLGLKLVLQGPGPCYAFAEMACKLGDPAPTEGAPAYA